MAKHSNSDWVVGAARMFLLTFLAAILTRWFKLGEMPFLEVVQCLFVSTTATALAVSLLKAFDLYPPFVGDPDDKP